MTFHTSHAGLIAIAGIVAASVLSQVCGRNIDISTIDYWGLGIGTIMTVWDYAKRHYGKGGQ